MGNDGEGIVILAGLLFGAVIGILLLKIYNFNKNIQNSEINIDGIELPSSSHIVDIEKTDSTYVYTIEVKR